jgi:hypothetical protein
LDAGNSATITIVVTARKPGTLANTATVSAPGVTPDADDSATATTTVTGPKRLAPVQCKKGDWRTFGVFKNQGDCVSFFATGGKNPPNGS